MGWLNFQSLSPLLGPGIWGWFLAGAVFITSIPVLIHLLNRRRFIVVDWAPMKYLKLTIRTNRRRMQIEQLLLLILRTLLMILLLLTIARLAYKSSGVSSWLAKRSRVSRVIVLDDSLVMGYRTNGKPAFDLAKQAASEMLHGTGGKDAITFLTTIPGAQPLVKEASSEDSAKLIGQIQTLQTTDAAANWAGTFKTVDDCLSSATFPQKQVVLITDLRRSGWTNEVTDFANRWAAKGVEARVIDIDQHGTANVALLKFSQDDPLVLPNTPVKLTATIRNDTTVAINASQATLTIDGQTRPVMLPDLPPGATVEVPLSATFANPGQHMVKLALSDDALPGDNIRYLSINVRDRLDVVLVDGRQGAGPFESAADFLNVAFSIGQEPWHTQRISDTDSQANRPSPVDLVCIVDAANLTPTAVTQYEKLVKQGMGLMIFAGEQVDPSMYNDRLFKNGNGLLPARIDRILDGPVKGLVVEPFGDSPLSAMAKIAPAALSRISTKRLLDIDTAGKPVEGVRVLARWNDAEGHPAIIEKRLGKGRVLLWTTTADREWTDWPVDPTYVLAVRSSALSVARPDSGDDNLIAGHELIIPPSDEPKLNPRLLVVDDPTPVPIPLLRYAHTEHAGGYTLLYDDPAGKEQHHQLAVSFDRAASDLEPLGEDQLAKLLGNLKADVVLYHPGDLAATGPGHEIWRFLAGTLLALMVVETLFACFVGREK
jgi:hypothetical protein